MLSPLEMLAALGVQLTAPPPAPETAASEPPPQYLPRPPAPRRPIEPPRIADGGIAAQGRLEAIFSAWDYPQAARIARAEGTVFVRYIIGIDGRAHDCAILRSSGHAELDAITCTLILRRFRPSRALDRAGNPRPETQERRVTWRNPPPPDPPAPLSPGR